MSETRERDGKTYVKPEHVQFIDDMEEAGFDVRHYSGRWFYQGPAVSVDDLQDAMSETKISVGWDNLGMGFIVHPAVSDSDLELKERPKSQTDKFTDRYGV